MTVRGRVACLATCAWLSVATATPAVAAPSDYLHHTFYGSADADRAYGVVVDAAGSSYIVGRSRDTWNGPAGQPPLHAHAGAGAADIVVVKLDASGAYQWHTFYGSGSTDYALAAALDGAGNLYVAGFSWGAWTGPMGELPKHAYGGGTSEACVLKLDGAGTYQWHTFYGAGYAGTLDEGHGIAVDAAGNAYLAMKSDDTWNGPMGEMPKNAYVGGPDIGIVKLDTLGDYQWHAFFGTDDADVEPASIAVDGTGVYVTGNSPAGWDVGMTAPLHDHSGGEDFVIVKVNAAGTYQWHTFYGSPQDDAGNGIAVSNGRVYVAGYSNDTWDGPGPTAPTHTYTGMADLTVLQLSASGDYGWHTFFGSAQDDFGLDVAVDGNAGIVIVGRSLDTWSVGSSGPAHAYTGGADALVVSLSSGGTYQWHTFYGSADEDLGQDIAIGALRSIHVAGSSRATWNGDAGALPLHAYTGDQDLFELVLFGGPLAAAASPAPALSAGAIVAAGLLLVAIAGWRLRAARRTP